MDEQKIAKLTEADVWDIQAHFNRAMDTEAGSGDHWILMACLNRHGFKTGGTIEAMRTAEEVIVKWYQLQQ